MSALQQTKDILSVLQMTYNQLWSEYQEAGAHDLDRRDLLDGLERAIDNAKEILGDDPGYYSYAQKQDDEVYMGTPRSEWGPDHPCKDTLEVN